MHAGTTGKWSDLVTASVCATQAHGATDLTNSLRSTGTTYGATAARSGPGVNAGVAIMRAPISLN